MGCGGWKMMCARARRQRHKKAASCCLLGVLSSPQAHLASCICCAPSFLRQLVVGLSFLRILLLWLTLPASSAQITATSLCIALRQRATCFTCPSKPLLPRRYPSLGRTVAALTGLCIASPSSAVVPKPSALRQYCVIVACDTQQASSLLPCLHASATFSSFVKTRSKRSQHLNFSSDALSNTLTHLLLCGAIFQRRNSSLSHTNF